MHLRLLLMALVFAPSLAHATAPGGYDPGEPYATNCVPACVPTNGTCNTDCSITCDADYGDCNGNVADGCETHLTDVGNCGSCGNDCGQCNDHPVCNAGACSGRPRPNGTFCKLSRTCNNPVEGSACMSGSCQCVDGTDMALPIVIGPRPDMAHGHDLPGDCSFTGGGTATATMMLLVSVAVLLGRRRRRG